MSHRIVLAALAAAAISAPALSQPIVVTGNPTSFRSLEFDYAGQERVDAARASLGHAIPVGSSIADARALLKEAGAHCDRNGAAAMHCTASSFEADNDVLHDVVWTVDVQRAGDRVGGLAIDRASIGS